MSRRVARATWAWLAVLLLGAIGIVWQGLRPLAAHAPDDHGAAAARLVPTPEAQWTSVELLDARGMHRFERDAAGRWLLHAEASGEPAGHAHRAEPAAAERIGTVFGAFSRAGIERRFPADGPAQLATYGLDRPSVIVLIRGVDARPVLTLEVGQVAPDALSRYVRLPRDGSVLTIANFHITGLLGLVDPPPPPAASATR